MNARENISVPASFTRRELLALLGGGVAALAGCGGGGDGVAGVSSGGTGFSVGPITGFGSIIVNGIRFGDSGATITDEDNGSVLRSSLRLGMMARITGHGIDDNLGTGVADTVIVDSQLKGQIEINPDPAARTFRVLGQTVEVTDSTIFDVDSLPNGFGSLAAGQFVEVHGMVDFVTNTIQATFIEREENLPNEFRIEGQIRNLANEQFNIGTGPEAITVRIVTTGPTPTRIDNITLANNVLVRVRLDPASVAPNTFNANRIRPPEKALDVDEAEVEGIISPVNFVSAFDFEINGLKVNVAAGAEFLLPPGSSTADIKPGARVEVEGRISGGVLIATRVELEDDVDEFELHGTVSALNLVAKSFTLTSGTVVVTVTFDDTTTFVGVVAEGLDNRSVEVKGTVIVGATGTTTIAAASIELEG